MTAPDVTAPDVTEPEVAVVVGAGPGIGSAVARRFGRGGYRVALVARRAEALEEQASRLGAEGIEAAAFPADAADPASLAAAFAAVRQRWGDPAVLHYNVSVANEARPSALDPEAVVASFRPNVVGGLVAAQQVLPAMRDRHRGTILFTGGGLALEPSPDYANLAVGKTGLRSLCLSLAKELEPDGVHVATVTVAGFVKAGTRFDPELIAEQFWRLHAQEPGAWEREVVYR